MALRVRDLMTQVKMRESTDRTLRTRREVRWKSWTMTSIRRLPPPTLTWLVGIQTPFPNHDHNKRALRGGSARTSGQPR
jgi:hypothetical protein